MIKKWFNVSAVLDREGYINWISTVNKKIRLIRIEDFKVTEVNLENLMFNYVPVPGFIEDRASDNQVIMNKIKEYEKDWREQINEAN
ncbi:MAG: hypothetical protein ACRC1T_05075 [Clostridium chrysemydis]|uniref:hypothetical protein n=1 Tax=Clostridium chrysemydis TaxID=2665504 RepID=UPI003F3B6964